MRREKGPKKERRGKREEDEKVKTSLKGVKAQRD
jgi:hypothetical protein